jgi:hypothetical protein
VRVGVRIRPFNRKEREAKEHNEECAKTRTLGGPTSLSRRDDYQAGGTKVRRIQSYDKFNHMQGLSFPENTTIESYTRVNPNPDELQKNPITIEVVKLDKKLGSVTILKKEGMFALPAGQGFTPEMADICEETLKKGGQEGSKTGTDRLAAGTTAASAGKQGILKLKI